jgi:molybdopterin converting factor small subunit
MSIKVIIEESFRPATGGVEEVEVEGDTIGQCLQETVKKFPGLKKIWFKGENKPTPYILVFLNGENIGGSKLARKVKDRDEICPLLIIGGG